MKTLSDKITTYDMLEVSDVKEFIENVATIMMISDRRERLKKLKERAGPKLIEEKQWKKHKHQDGKIVLELDYEKSN